MKPRTMFGAACMELTVALAASTSSGGHMVSAGGKPAGRHGVAIKVGSFNFPEGVLLAGIHGRALAAHNYPVGILPNRGTRELVDPGLMDGLLQPVPEYAGSAREVVSLGHLLSMAHAAPANRALARSLAGRGLLAARPAATQNTSAIVVTAATGARYGLRSITDLARVALRARDIGVALLFTTNPSISVQHLVVLADDRALQPAETITPVVRRNVVARYGTRLLTLIDAVSARLTTGSLRSPDARVVLDGGRPRSVAEARLRAQGLMQAGGVVR